jgi:hypothetical protein
MAERYVLPTRQHADLVIPGDALPADSVERVRSLLKALPIAR